MNTIKNEPIITRVDYKPRNFYVTTKQNYVFENYSQANFGPSQAVPDQTLSLRELLRRHASGLPLAGNIREPQYDEENVQLNFASMDLADLQEMAEDLNSKVAAIDKEQRDKKKAEADEKLRQSIIDEHTDRQRWEDENKPKPPQPN